MTEVSTSATKLQSAIDEGKMSRRELRDAARAAEMMSARLKELEKEDGFGRQIC